jgi:hypothetical protein
MDLHKEMGFDINKTGDASSNHRDSNDKSTKINLVSKSEWIVPSGKRT